jgi:hypothetical protein
MMGRQLLHLLLTLFLLLPISAAVGRRKRSTRHTSSSSTSSSSSYQTLFYNQTLNHFDPSDNRKFQHRFLFNDEHWDGSGELENGCKGPILLYTGNEGDIEAFWEANGFMHEYLAPKCKVYASTQTPE